MQPHGGVGQLASSSNGQLAQLQLPGCLAGSGNSSSSSADHSFAAAPPLPGVTSLYGKLRCASVLPATTADAQPLPAGSCCAGPFSSGTLSSTGTVAGWQGHKQYVAGSVVSTDNNSSMLQHPPAVASSAWPGRSLQQYSLFSKSSASGSHTSSRSSSRSTTSSISTASVAAAPTDQGLSASFLGAAASPAPAAPAASAAQAASDYGVLLEALGLSGAGRAGSSSSNQQSAPTDPLAAYGNTAQLLRTPPALSTAPASSDLPQHSHLLQQLQQLQINEHAQAVAHAQGTVHAQSSSISSMRQPLSSSDVAAGLTPASYAAMQKQLLMVQLQDLQQSLQTQSASTATCPGSLAGSAGCNLLGSFDPAVPLSSMTPSPALLGSSTQQQEASNQQAALAQLLAQLAPGTSFNNTTGSSSTSMLATMLSSMQAQHGPAGLAMPSTVDPSVAAAIEGLEQQLLLSCAGSALPPAAHGVFDSFAGLAPASAAAVVGSLAGLLPAGKHTLQMGPGNNPMYKTEMCRTWIETGGCRYGSRCQFAHSPQELRPVTRHPKYKTQPCRTFSVHGSCPYGDRCNFIHDVQPSAQSLADNTASSSSGFSTGF